MPWTETHKNDFTWAIFSSILNSLYFTYISRADASKDDSRRPWHCVVLWWVQGHIKTHIGIGIHTLKYTIMYTYLKSTEYKFYRASRICKRTYLWPCHDLESLDKLVLAHLGQGYTHDDLAWQVKVKKIVNGNIWGHSRLCVTLKNGSKYQFSIQK